MVSDHRFYWHTTSNDRNRIFYVQIIYNAALIPIFWLILRETRSDVILKRRARKIRKETGRHVYAASELNAPRTLR